MKRFSVLLTIILAAVVFSGCASEKAEQSDKLRIIFETDVGNDVDDAMALDMLYKYLDQEKIDLLAVMINKSAAAPAEYMDIMNT